MSDLVAALADPGFYPERPASVEIRETHISWVFLTAERAYKLKKPLVLPFLDYGTAERRREMCREEVRLNRVLAPDIYVGVRAIARLPDGFALAEESDARAVDYVVEMRRYDEALSRWRRSSIVVNFATPTSSSSRGCSRTSTPRRAPSRSPPCLPWPSNVG